MPKVTRSFQTSLLMRVGATKELQSCYDNRTLTFVCAANWIDYALKEENNVVGDIHECAFAHLSQSDPRIEIVVDSHGRPMGDHLLILQDMTDSTCFLCFIPTILTPVICFYTFNIEKVLAALGGADTSILVFDLDQYREGMKYDAGKSSYLLITDPVRFVDELGAQIPIAVHENQSNLTSKRFYGDFHPEEPMTAMDVVYDRHSAREQYFDMPGNQDELFWKYPEYGWQSELRIAVQNINYIQSFGPDMEYDYKKNRLTVQLPHLQEYAQVVAASDAHSLLFYDFDNVAHTYRFLVSSMMQKELIAEKR